MSKKNIPAHLVVGSLPPSGYIAWHEWAKAQDKGGLKQSQCGECGLCFFPQEAINHAPEKACSRRIAIMNLYEIINGDMGESYVRVYVWAEDEEQAYSFAGAKFNEKGYKISTPLSIKFLFSQDEKPFCTIPSDTGFVCETTSKKNYKVLHQR